jgi:RND family efflux transporter MFP subunit
MGAENVGRFAYNDVVSYPFGWGLNYTSYSFTDFAVEKAGEGQNAAYNVSVTVTNTGDRAGKKTVQIYAQKPYTDYDREHKIEKAAVDLVLADGSTFGEKGEVDYTENVADESTDTLRVYARFANAERVLRPGGTVGVKVWNRDGVKKPSVPPSAVMQDVQGPYVWALDASGAAQKRYIVRGRMTGDLLFVTEGLSVGERVVTDGTHKVAPGDVVTPAP